MIAAAAHSSHAGRQPSSALGSSAMSGADVAALAGGVVHHYVLHKTAKDALQVPPDVHCRAGYLCRGRC